MEQRAGTAVRVAVLLGALFTALFPALPASSQIVVDYALQILESNVPYPGGEVRYALVVTADWWTDAREPFVVQLTVPAGLEPGTQCDGGDGDVRFDAATRVLTWSARLDNPSIALSSCPLLFRVDPLIPPGTTFSLRATLATSKPDPNPSNDIAAITSLVLAASDIEVRSSADRRTLKPGETITYTLEVKNLGPQAAHNVSLTDELSPLVDLVSFEQTSGPPALRDPECSLPGCVNTIVGARIGLLPAESVATFRLVVVAKTSFESADIRNRLAAHSPSSVDLAERNNFFDEVVFAGPDADLAIGSEVSHASRTRSTVKLRITNEGPEAVNAVTVQSVLATVAGRYDFARLVRFASVTPSQGTCTTALRHVQGGHPPPPDSWTMDCQVGMLAPGAVATITVVIEGSPAAGRFRHSASVRPAQNDPRPQNNQTQTQLTSSAPRRRAARH